MQDKLVAAFQGLMGCRFVQKEFPIFQNSSNPDFVGIKDRADVYARFDDDYEVIIEIDATRADQLAKKLLSRYCYHLDATPAKKLIYISLLYPGTDKMNVNECKKYFLYGETLMKTDANAAYIGYIIGQGVLTSCLKLNAEEESLEIDNYTAYLHLNHIEKSVASYRTAVSKVQKYWQEHHDTHINDCIKALLAAETHSNDRTYLQSYLNWRLESNLP